MAPVLRDIIAESLFTTVTMRATKAAKKAGVDRDEATAIFDAVLDKTYGVRPAVQPDAGEKFEPPMKPKA